MKNIKFAFKIFLLTPLTALILASLAFTTLNYPSLRITTPPDTKNTKPQPQISISDILSSSEMKNYIDRSVASIISDSNQKTQPNKKTAFKILSSTVRITSAPIGSSTQGAIGTGVIIKNEEIKGKRNYFKAYIITNYHVVSNAVQVKIENFHYLQEKTIGETVVYAGMVLSRDPNLDLALIQVDSPNIIGHASSLISEDDYDLVSLYDPVFACGCPLGEPPCITNGNISMITVNYFIVSAHSIFGNSGGGLFTPEGKILGLVNQIGGIKLSNGLILPEPNITHVIPAPLVRAWLSINHFSV
jgi:S1-C subfamily serine protease